MCNVCDATRVVDATSSGTPIAFRLGVGTEHERVIFIEAKADLGVEFQPAEFRVRREGDEWTPMWQTHDLAGTMSKIGTDDQRASAEAARWLAESRTQEGDDAFREAICVPPESMARAVKFGEHFDLAASKKKSAERRKRRTEAIRRMLPRCVEYLGGSWTTRKSGAVYYLKREDGVKVKLAFGYGYWRAVPRTPGKVSAHLEAGKIKLEGTLESIAWVIARLP